MKPSYFQCPKCNAIVEHQLPLDSAICERCDNEEPILYQQERQEKLRVLFIEKRKKNQIIEKRKKNQKNNTDV